MARGRIWGWIVSAALSVAVHVVVVWPQVRTIWLASLNQEYVRLHNFYREAIAQAAAARRQRVLLSEVVLLPSSPSVLRVATAQPETQTERLRTIQQNIRRTWNALSAQSPGRALVALRIGEDGRIYEYAIRRLRGDMAFERFVVEFVQSLVQGPPLAGEGDALWVECEFVVEPPG